MNDQIPTTNQRSMIQMKSTYTPQAKAKMRTKIMVKNTYILVKRLTWRGWRNSYRLVWESGWGGVRKKNHCKKRLQLHCRVIKIKNLCSEVTKGNTKNYKEIISCPPLEHCLNKIKLLFNQRIERRCAEYNFTKKEDKQCESSDNPVTTSNYQIPMTNPRSMIQMNLTYISQAKAKMRTWMTVKNTYILVRKMTWRGLRNGTGLVKESREWRQIGGSRWKKNIAKRRNHPKKSTLQSLESIKPGNFDPLLCTAHWHHAERAHE